MFTALSLLQTFGGLAANRARLHDVRCGPHVLHLCYGVRVAEYRQRARARRSAAARIAFARHLLAITWWARLGWVVLAVVLVGLLGSSHGGGEPSDVSAALAHFSGGMRAASLGSGALVGMGAAGQRDDGVAHDGIAWLFASRGGTSRQVAIARGVAVTGEIFLRLFVFAIVATLWAIAETRRMSLAFLFVPSILYACASALVLGGLAHGARELGGRRGRGLLAALLVVPSLLGVAWAPATLLPAVWQVVLDAFVSLRGWA